MAWVRPSWLVVPSAAALLVVLLLQRRPSTAAGEGRIGEASPPSRRGRQLSVLDELELRGCERLFLDAGANLGEAVGAFSRGNFFQCAIHAPPRNHRAAWANLGKRQRELSMAPLREPRSFCIRSFEAAPPMLPLLHKEEAHLRASGFNVSFIDGALSNRTVTDEPRTLWRYATHQWGETALGLDFADVHVENKPLPMGSRVVRSRSYDLNEVLRFVFINQPKAVVVLRLDVEGEEWWMLERLVEQPDLLCRVSYIFAEFHSAASASQRSRLHQYGIDPQAFEKLKDRIHGMMDHTPHCRLKLYWRSFWASCGDKQRFEWRVAPQAAASSDSSVAAPEVQRAMGVPSALALALEPEKRNAR
mmetsp:Transcript_24775/g.69756  ORF Transcript_24775/g.69756 Transcript_24775/m.69756 type:complete len:361 (+) Transcript_24775:72-1154(+)